MSSPTTYISRRGCSKKCVDAAWVYTRTTPEMGGVLLSETLLVLLRRVSRDTYFDGIVLFALLPWPPRLHSLTSAPATARARAPTCCPRRVVRAAAAVFVGHSLAPICRSSRAAVAVGADWPCTRRPRCRGTYEFFSTASILENCQHPRKLVNLVGGKSSQCAGSAGGASVHANIPAGACG